MELSISFYAGKIFFHDTIRIRFSVILMELINIFYLKISWFFWGGGTHTLLWRPRPIVCCFVSHIKCINLDGTIIVIIIVIRIHTSK